MTFNPLLQANNIAIHDVINEDVCPSVPLVTGDSFNFRDADIKIRVNGNRCGVPTEALTFKIIVKGNGFRAILRAIWGVINATTAQVTIVQVDDPIAFNCWLRHLDLETGYEQAAAAFEALAISR